MEHRDLGKAPIGDSLSTIHKHVDQVKIAEMASGDWKQFGFSQLYFCGSLRKINDRSSTFS